MNRPNGLSRRACSRPQRLAGVHRRGQAHGEAVAGRARVAACGNGTSVRSPARAAARSASVVVCVGSLLEPRVDVQSMSQVTPIAAVPAATERIRGYATFAVRRQLEARRISRSRRRGRRARRPARRRGSTSASRPGSRAPTGSGRAPDSSNAWKISRPITFGWQNDDLHRLPVVRRLGRLGDGLDRRRLGARVERRLRRPGSASRSPYSA